MRIRPEKILCATDLSAYSNHALEYGIALARKFGARLFVCHAVDLSAAGLAYESSAFLLPAARAEMMEKARQELERLMSGVRTSDVRWEPIVLEGEASMEVEGAARRIGADLVVAATHGRAGIKRLLMGSITERLVESLDCPVLAVRQPGRGLLADPKGPIRAKRILVGCDFSPDSRAALDHALSLAQEFESEVHLVHVVEPTLYRYLNATTRALADEIERAVEDTVRGKLSELVPEEARSWCVAKPAIVPGLPWQAITEYAQKNEVDLIVLGVRGHGLIDKLLIGSTTLRVLREAQCPVLAVRTPPADVAKAKWKA